MLGKTCQVFWALTSDQGFYSSNLTGLYVTQVISSDLFQLSPAALWWPQFHRLH